MRCEVLEIESTQLFVKVIHQDNTPERYTDHDAERF
jgi:hypothetical protein